MICIVVRFSVKTAHHNQQLWGFRLQLPLCRFNLQNNNKIEQVCPQQHINANLRVAKIREKIQEIHILLCKNFNSKCWACNVHSLVTQDTSLCLKEWEAVENRIKEMEQFWITQASNLRQMTI